MVQYQDWCDYNDGALGKDYLRVMTAHGADVAPSK